MSLFSSSALALKVTVGVAVVLGGWWAVSVTTYSAAALQYEGLVKDPPATRLEVESRLWLFTQRRIKAEESSWGRHHQLQPGDYFMQYNIVGVEPIDVVYDRSGHCLAIYSSFE